MPEKSGEFEGWVKAKLEDTIKRLERIEAKIDIQNGDIDNLKQWRAGIVAVGGILVFAIPIVVKILW